MKCPKCGNDRNLVDHAFDSYVYCPCGTYFTEWQQSEIEALKTEVDNLEESFNTIAIENNELNKENESLRAKCDRAKALLNRIKDHPLAAEDPLFEGYIPRDYIAFKAGMNCGYWKAVAIAAERWEK